MSQCSICNTQQSCSTGCEIVKASEAILQTLVPTARLPSTTMYGRFGDSLSMQFEFFGKNAVSCYQSASVCISITFASVHIDWWTAARGSVWFCHRKGPSQRASRKCLPRLKRKTDNFRASVELRMTVKAKQRQIQWWPHLLAHTSQSNPVPLPLRWRSWRADSFQTGASVTANSSRKILI